MNVVLLETSGNQAYIFATNKLRENVGASELTYRCGTQWVLEAVEKITGRKLWSEKPDQLAKNLSDKSLNPDIETDSGDIEVIVAASGKALLLVKDREDGRQIVRDVTLQALKEAPGLDICGVVGDDFNWNTGSLGEAVKKAHLAFTEVHSTFPGPAMRHLRLPFVAECSSSGLPASQSMREGNEQVIVSEVSARKRLQREDADTRLKNTFPKMSFPTNIDRLSCDWHAVVHADVNGMGQVFQNLGDYCGEGNRSYADSYRNLSLALDACTRSAFQNAVQETWDSSKQLPLVPLVLAGDDLTVVCDGRQALKFAKSYLCNFETASGDNEVMKEIATKAFGGGTFACCAGIAITKPHFPFSTAYGLSEGLIRSAKSVKRLVDEPCSALDFYLLHDSSVVGLDDIRSRITFESGGTKTRLYGGPYIVSPLSTSGNGWSNAHKWELLENCERALLQKQDDKRLLPNSQMHDLRAALHMGKEAADAAFALISHRYDGKSIKKIESSPGSKSVFWTERADTEEVHITRLLDAMDIAELGEQ